MSSAGRRRIDEIGDESRRRILDAAEELFAERGFERTSFVDIAERSGISRGSIPWHFKNKEGLVMAVVERAIDRFMGPAQYESLPSLATLVHDYATWVRSGNSALMFMVLTEALSGRGTVHAQYRTFLEQRRKGVEQWLRAQRPDGVDPEVAAGRERAVAVTLTGAVTGIHLQSVLDPNGIDLEESLRSLVTMVGESVADLWTRPASDGAPRTVTE
ncbi:MULTISPECIES: TetR/AcrR family transcriptional regulator [unclassified Streptomyces]|uniref:TetR/AcrR family transcriptional regulator n=1 Tax=unclassified Streptomyces TaxID=2593676 RepID=UPI00068EB953|nr:MULTISPECIES: TetR/AcrR family transcriptional regulator [unclassified Streptomyces]